MNGASIFSLPFVQSTFAAYNNVAVSYGIVILYSCFLNSVICEKCGLSVSKLFTHEADIFHGDSGTVYVNLQNGIKVLFFPNLYLLNMNLPSLTRTGRISPTSVSTKTYPYTYEVDNNYKLDLNRLHLNMRMVVFIDKSGKWSKEISIVISGISISDDIWIEGEYSIEDGDSLYKPFRAYFIHFICIYHAVNNVFRFIPYLLRKIL